VTELYRVIDRCRSCGSAALRTFLDLGTTPLADRLRVRGRLDEPEPKAPLTVAFCEQCALVQILETVDPVVLFCQDYPYFSSVSKQLLAHFESAAVEVLHRRPLHRESLVMEAASNDGYLLRHFAARGIPVLGIDPAAGPASIAIAAGIPTMVRFFSLELAERFRDAGRQADVFLANNVLAHVPDLNGFIRGVATVLKPGGLAVFECPYWVDLVEHTEFDTIYHQHLCYFSVTALARLFERNGLFLNDVERVVVHGGSLRLFVEFEDRQSPRTRALLALERERGVDRFDYCSALGVHVAELKARLIALLIELKGAGCRVVGYGAAAKACTLLSYCGIDQRLLDYVVDLNSFKQGKFMGGTPLEIRHPDALLQDAPDYVLILAWNFAAEIMKQQREYSARGGRFIVPVPTPKVVTA
jgi:SAM-dependent methyltransferase